MDQAQKKKLALLKLVGKSLDKPRPPPLPKSEPSPKKKPTVKGIIEAQAEAAEKERLEAAKKLLLESLKEAPPPFLREQGEAMMKWRAAKQPVPFGGMLKSESAYTLEKLEREMDEAKREGHPEWQRLKYEADKLRYRMAKQRDYPPPLPEDLHRSRRALLRWMERMYIPILPEMGMRAFREYGGMAIPEAQEIQQHTAEFLARRLIAPSDMERIAELWMQAEANDALQEFQDEIVKQLRLGARHKPENLKGPALW